MNGRSPASDLDLRPWLDGGGSDSDIIAVAFEEIVPLNAQNVVIGEFQIMSLQTSSLISFGLPQQQPF